MSQSIEAANSSRIALAESANADRIADATTDQGALTPEYRAKVKHAAESFEGFFIEQILQQMRRSTREIDPDDAESAKRGDDDMLDMTDAMVAQALSSQHAFGVADAILQQLLPAGRRDVPAGALNAGLKMARKPVASVK